MVRIRLESGMVPDFYRKLDAASVKEAAKLYLNTQSFVKVTLFPEKKP